ncbi:MAG TPA: penicillin-binding transpeptidase domain-containing protein, partial [Egibacteraceae bacterium]|nr:penicillin-binding transpeptidase domain-containing protein [Egibacteraceae bacterium]
MTSDRRAGIARRPLPAALAAALVAAALGWWLAVALRVPDEQRAAEAASAYLAAWQRGDWPALQGLLAQPAPDAVAVHRQMLEALQVSELRLSGGPATIADDVATVGFDAQLRLAGLGGWSYRGALTLRPGDERWAVVWSPAVLHPALQAGQRFARSRAWPTRAPILGVDGASLAASSDAIVVGIIPARVVDRAALVSALVAHVDADAAAVEALLDRPGLQPGAFHPVAELPRARYEQVRPQLYPVPGTAFRERADRLLVGPSLAALVGRVGELNAEALGQLGEPYLAGDVGGLWGLERVFERRLAGRPGGEVRIQGADGRVAAVLHRFDGAPPEPLGTVLDARLQAAAAAALDGVGRNAALVVIDAPTGQVRAAVNRPAGGFDRALAGRYPPGSTFKVVTTYALLGTGVQPDTPTTCPARARVGGRSFRNFEGTALGQIPFRAAFAQSCNTAFVTLASGLDPGALQRAAATFGFGVGYDFPLPATGGSFPPPRDAVEQAAAAIGQARVEASPLHMASVAAAIAGGAWRPPQLLAGPAAPGRPLDPDRVQRLRELMGLVVSEGTGQRAGVPGPPVAGKTGTAEYGPGDPPATHAWFIGFRGPLAVAVLVEGGDSGGVVAAPVAP